MRGMLYHAMDIAHLIENTWDLAVEKTLAPDFSFVIYGDYVYRRQMKLP